MRRSVAILTICLYGCAVALAQGGRRTGINLSLWKNVATQRSDTVGTTWLNIGLCSDMNRLDGIGVNVLGSSVRRSMKGMHLAGIASMTGGESSGLAVGGLVNIIGGKTNGVAAAGLVQIAGTHVCGVTAGGLLNMAGGGYAGIQLSGMANINGGRMAGCSVSGMLNVAGSTARGMQLAGIGNITAGTSQGVQLAPLGNVTGGSMSGVQVALFNYADSVRGLQLGLVNIYKHRMKGVQLGLANITPDTRVQLMLFGSNHTKINAGVRLQNRLFYTIIGGGAPYLDFSDDFSASFFYRTGIGLPLYRRLRISSDLGYQHMELFGNRHHGYPARLYALQMRAGLELGMTARTALFIHCGYGWDRRYRRNATYQQGVLIEGGVILF